MKNISSFVEYMIFLVICFILFYEVIDVYYMEIVFKINKMIDDIDFVKSNNVVMSFVRND